MKKIIVIALAVFLLLSLATCKSREAEQPASEEPANSAGMVNPWSDVDTAEAAADGAGVGYFQLPAENYETSGGPVNWVHFSYMKGLAQANGYVGTAELLVRKGLKQDSEDVSGDYTEYTCKWTLELDGTQINCFGNEEGKTMKAIWLSDNFSYCFLVRGQGDIHDTYGIDKEATLALVSEIQ